MSTRLSARRLACAGDAEAAFDALSFAESHSDGLHGFCPGARRRPAKLFAETESNQSVTLPLHEFLPSIPEAPRVSFVIPVRNDARRLKRCLTTIRANRYPADRLEIVVVDNGSLDDSCQVARQAGAKVLVLPGLSVSQLRNRGTATASGDILAFVDADHEIVPEWLESAAQTMAGASVAAAGSLCHPPGDGTWVQAAYNLLRRRSPHIHDVEWLGSGNMVVSRRAFQAVGGFDDSLETCEDVDLCRRLRAMGYRIVDDPRMHNVHLGDPKGLRDLFVGELWRGRDNLRVSLRGKPTPRELISVGIPILFLAGVASLLAAAFQGVLFRPFLGAGLGAIGGVWFLRSIRMLRQAPAVTVALVVQCLAVAFTYEAARAFAVVMRKRHHRVAQPAVAR